MTDAAWEEAASKEQMDRHEDDKKQRWERALAAFTKLDELLAMG